MPKLRIEHPRALALSILAGMQVMTAGSVLNDTIGPKPAALIGLTVGAAQMALASYMHGTKRRRAARHQADEA